MGACLRLIVSDERRQVGSAVDMVTAAGLGLEAALSTALPGLLERMADSAIAQACTQLKPIPVQVAETRPAQADPRGSRGHD